MKKTVSLMLALILLLAVQPGAMAAGFADSVPEAQDITDSCTLTPSSNEASFKKAIDGSLKSAWTSREGSQTIGIEVGGGAAPGGVYLRWNKEPPAWTLVALDNGETVVATGGGNGRLSDYAAIPGAYSACKRFELCSDGEEKLSITEISVYSNGKRPSYLPRWREFSGRADVMVISAHPDDDQLYMGGVIPTYVEQGKTAVTVFMTYGTADRRFEALEGVCTAGSTFYPTLGTLPDKLTKSVADAKTYWPEAKTAAYIAEQIRKYKPSVIVTHSLTGEYGHGAHMWTAKLVEEAFERCGDEDYYPESAEEYGVWNPAKLYLHHYGENKLTLDTSVPLTRYGGKTALEVAIAGYDRHGSQHRWSFKVQDTGRDSICDFGLAATRVGQDQAHDDMFENVTREAVAQINPQYQDTASLKLAVQSAKSVAESGYAALRFSSAALQAETGRAEAVLGNTAATQQEIDAAAAALYAELRRAVASVWPCR